jgi:hypothetical protein
MLVKAIPFDVDVHIRHVESGVTRVYRSEEFLFPNDNGEWSCFNWSDNNYACDCNRALFWSRAGSEEDLEIPCSDRKYRVDAIVRVSDGEKLYEDDWDA